VSDHALESKKAKSKKAKSKKATQSGDYLLLSLKLSEQLQDFQGQAIIALCSFPHV
jgi:hypothetical protein